MAQNLTTEDIQKLIDASILSIKKDVGLLKTKQTALDNKLNAFLKKTNATDLLKMLTEFKDIKTKIDALSATFGSFDMNDVSIVVDAKTDTIGFNIGQFGFISTVELVDGGINNIRPEQNCEGAKQDYYERYEFVKNAGVDAWDNFITAGKKDGRTWDMSKCKGCSLSGNLCSILK